MSTSNELRRVLAGVERLEREAVQVDRLAQANDQLCDDIAAAGERIRVLEAALALFANGEGSVTAARAALLGMDLDEVDGREVNAAWLERAEGRAA